jgi:hypothetical protein
MCPGVWDRLGLCAHVERLIVSVLYLAAPRHLLSLPTLKTTAFAAFCFLDDPALQHFQAMIEISD